MEPPALVKLLDLVGPVELVVVAEFPHCPLAEPVLAPGLVPEPWAPQPSSQRR
jgi:hypothetical protein